MVRQSLNAWLACFLRDEIEQVITWKDEVLSGIKIDPETRFDDDGSNFRSLVTLPHPDGGLVQLVKVLSLKGLVSAIISDGDRKIKAHLSESCVAALEAEAEEQFNFDTVGDVFQLTQYTVVTTPFGPSDGFVHLSIDEIEYRHHLRKIHGDPLPIEEEDSIRRLLERIVRLRCPETRSPDSERSRRNGESSQLAAPRSSVVESQQDSQDSSDAPIQSQFPVRKRARAPCLSEDGFAIETGLNLQRPFQTRTGLSIRADRGKQMTEIFALKGTRKPSPQPEQPTRQSPEIIAETPIRPPKETVEAETRPESDEDQQLVQQVDFQQHDLVPANRSPPSIQPPSEEPSGVPQSTAKSRLPYRHYKIPANQQKLLDRPESWLPSLPGHRFPHPNVPIDLLDKWNKSVSMAHTISAPLQQKSNAFLEPQDIEQPSDTSTNVSSDSEDEIPESQWPPTPSQHKPELPPESSFGSAPRGSQQDDLEIVAPRALPLPVQRGGSAEHVPRSHVDSALLEFPQQSLSRKLFPVSQTKTTLSQASPQGSILLSQTISSPQETAVNSSPFLIHNTAPHKANGLDPERFKPPPSAPTGPRAYTSYRRLSSMQGSPGLSDKHLLHPHDIDSSPPVHATQVLVRSQAPTMPHHNRHKAPPSEVQTPSQRPTPNLSSSNASLPPKPPSSLVSSQWRDPSMVGRRSTAKSFTPTRTEIHTAREGNSERPPYKSQEQPISINRSNDTSHQDVQKRQNPDEDHRLKRRQFMEAGRRRDWLKLHYVIGESGPYRLRDVITDYGKSQSKYQDVNIVEEDFMNAVQAAFPESEVNNSTSFSKRLDDPSCVSKDTGSELKDSTSWKKTHPETPPPAPALEAWKARKARNAGKLHSDNSSGNSSNREVQPDLEQKLRRKQKLRPPQQQHHGPGAMQEFCENWLNIRPGGAFAPPEVPQRRRTVGRHVDLLKWNI